MPCVSELVDLLDRAASLAIVCHDNPDPDCIASALALEYVADSTGITDVAIVYGGDISHQQNRTLVNALDIELEGISDIDFETYERVALVDHSGTAGRSQLPEGLEIDAIVDHHLVSKQTKASFVDIRSEYGTTSSILVEYLRELDLERSPTLASALLFALHRERLDYVRHPTPHEYEAALHVCAAMDMSLIEQMYGSAFSPTTLDAIGEAIRSRRIRGSALISSVGRTAERDALAQAADYLLNPEGISTAVVFGIVGNAIHVSARSVDPRVNVGEVLQEAFQDVGSAGGHRDMAGAQIPLGIFADHAEDDDELLGFISIRVVERFFDTMHLDDEAEVEGT